MSQEDILESDRAGSARHPRETMALFGQSEAEATFLTACRAGRLHHAWLIMGSRGIGKATLAWRIARYMLIDAKMRAEGNGVSAGLPRDCLDVPEGHAVTRQMIALSEPGIRLVRRPYDGKSKRLRKFITVGEIRGLKTFFELTSADGLPRVVIVDSADEMNASASNAVLKVLEEPPENSYFFLISHSPSCLLPTIRSRCRTLKCKPLPKPDLVKAMKQAGGTVSDAEIDSMVELTCGSVGDALRLRESDGLETYTRLIELISKAPGIPRHKVIEFASSCDGKENEGHFETAIQLLLRLLERLALHGAFGMFPVQAARGELELSERLCGNLEASRSWAMAHDELSRIASGSREVNIDPFSVMHDMLAKVDRTAAKVMYLQA